MANLHAFFAIYVCVSLADNLLYVPLITIMLSSLLIQIFISLNSVFFSDMDTSVSGKVNSATK